jgi:hypothetical protein
MVSKLLLAAQEVYFRAASEKVEPGKLDKLRNIYYDIKRGIGVEKTPDIYGAFPTDAYSHTPSFAGVQQPGMTGQVKEDIISRMHELGLFIRDGKIIINPSLLNFNEFLKTKDELKYYELFGDETEFLCPENCLAFTYCQIPFIYRLSDRDQISVTKNDGEKISTYGLVLNENISQSIFNREGKVTKVEVMINRN